MFEPAAVSLAWQTARGNLVSSTYVRRVVVFPLREGGDRIHVMKVGRGSTAPLILVDETCSIVRAWSSNVLKGHRYIAGTKEAISTA